MSDEQSARPEVKDLTATSLGYIIAFLLPGLLSLFGLRYWSDDVKTFLQPALRAEANIGPSAIILLVALGLGICIGVIRGLVFEKIVCRRQSLPNEFFKKLVEKDKLALFKIVIDEQFRYHQFYGGCVVALVIVYAGWAHESYCGFNSQFAVITLVFLAFEALLSYGAKVQYEDFVGRATFIITGSDQQKR